MTLPAAPTPTVRRSFVRYQGAEPIEVQEDVIGEIRFTVFLDGKELVTFMCSPWKLRELVLGFLYLEGLLDTIRKLEASDLQLHGCTSHTIRMIGSAERIPNKYQAQIAIVPRHVRHRLQQGTYALGGIHESEITETERPTIVAIKLPIAWNNGHA